MNRFNPTRAEIHAELESQRLEIERECTLVATPVKPEDVGTERGRYALRLGDHVQVFRQHLGQHPTGTMPPHPKRTNHTTHVDLRAIQGLDDDALITIDVLPGKRI